MPVTEEHALRQIEIEAMRGILDNLRRLNASSEKQTEVLHGIDVRLVRIESNSVSDELAKVRTEVDELKEDKLRREGALSLSSWFFRNWPTVILLFILAGMILRVAGKI